MELLFSLGDMEKPQFKLHGSSLASKNLRIFPLFHDVKLEVIGLQMLLNIKGSRDATIGGEVNKIATNKKEKKM